MPRYTAKTYGKKGAKQEPKASRQFDQLLVDTRTTRRGTIRLSPSPSPKKHSPTKQPQRSAPVSPSRATRRMASEMDAFDSPKRRRIASGSDDPFSFNSDDDTPKSPPRRGSSTSRNNVDGNNTNNSSEVWVIPSSPNADDNMRQTRGSIAQWEQDNKIQTRSSASPLSPGGRSNHSTSSQKKQTATNVRQVKRAIFNSADSESSESAAAKANSAAAKETELKVQRTSRYDIGGKRSGNGPNSQPSKSSAPTSPHSSPPSSPPGSPNTRRVSRMNSVQSTTTTTTNNVQNNSSKNNTMTNNSKPAASTLQTSVAKLALGPNASAASSKAKPDESKQDEFDFTDSEEEEEEEEPRENAMNAGGANAVPKRIFNSPKKVSL